MFDSKKKIEVNPEVESFIRNEGRDFRLCTTCGGPVIVPLELKSSKPSDIKIEIGDYTLYVSKVQARYLKRIEMSMLKYYIDLKENDRI